MYSGPEIGPPTFISGYMCPDTPDVDLTNPKTRGKLDSALRYGFPVRNGQLVGSGVFGSKGENFPFRGAYLESS